MSVRRPKIHIKPKLSSRSLTPKARPPNTSTETAVKSIESTSEESQNKDQTNSLVETSVTELSTKVIAVDVNENSQTNDTNNNLNRCLKDSVIENRTELNANKVVDQRIVVEDVIRSSETNTSELDSNKQQTFETRTKSKTESVASRKRKICRNSQKSDKSVMRMKDLLLYNPPMTEEQKEMKDKDVDQSTDKTNETQSSDLNSEVCEQDSNDSNEANAGPRVKVGTDGLLILDEESVVVKRQKPLSMNDSPLLENAGTTSALTNYSSFRSRTKGSSKPRWTEHETIRFYSALNTIGTDFTLMADLFFRGKRSRLDLRNKFKKEERVNKLMIDEALFSPNTFINQCPELDGLSDDSSDSEEDNDQQNLSLKPKSTKSKS